MHCTDFFGVNCPASTISEKGLQDFIEYLRTKKIHSEGTIDRVLSVMARILSASRK